MVRRLIKASHIVAFQKGGHRHLRDGVVIVEDDRIAGVAKTFEGHADEIVDATGRIVTPGLINTHAHITESPIDKSYVEDRGPRQFYLSGLFEFLPPRDRVLREEDRQACIAFSMAELVRSGTTTIMELGGHGESVAAAAAATGLRAYIAQSYRSGRWFTDDGRTVKYQWFEDDGRAAFDRAVAFIAGHEGSHGGLIRGFLAPSQVDTVSEAMLRRSRAAASEMRVPLALHTSQSVPEFQEMTRRHGRTPIEWLESIGFLGPDVILGHAIIAAGGSWANYHGDDVAILAATGTNVAHAVWVFARRGIAMESFARYLARGVNMTIATDTCPQSMIEAMRWTAVVAKIVDRRTEVATAADVFKAATLGGAKALGRDDLGRIAPGAKADLIVWDAETLTMAPVRDPLRNIVYSAASSDIESVMIDGRWVMRDRAIPGVDERALARRLQGAGEAMWRNFHKGDWAGRTMDQLSPPSLPPFEP
jgi:cytosine/adenosine deaminase-related metal-dependent hydrolase